MNTDNSKLKKSTDNTESEELDVLALVGSLLRGWKTILFFTLLGLISALLYSRYLTPIYESDALIQIDDQSQGVSGLGENISELVDVEDNELQAEAELIKSRMLLELVVDLLDLQVLLVDPTITVVDKVIENQINTQVNTPDIVSLETIAGLAQISQFEVESGYLNRDFTLLRSETGFILKNDVDEFKGKLNQLQEFRGTNGSIQITVNKLPATPITIKKQSLQATISSISNNLTVVEKGDLSGFIQVSLTGTNQQQVSSILEEIVKSYVIINESRGSEETTNTLDFMETQLPLLKQNLESSEALFNDFRQQYGTIDVGREAELLLTENAQIDSQLNELKLSKAELTTYYTNEHPSVIQINEQLGVLNSRKQVIGSTVKGLPEIQREFLQLSEDVSINREIYLVMLKNYEQLKVVQAGQVGYARILDLPVSTYSPIEPNRNLILLTGLLFGAALGIFIILLKNLARDVVKDPNELETIMGVPVLAIIPRSKSFKKLITNKKSTARLLAHVEHNGLSYEAIKSLRTYLLFGAASKKSGNHAQVILVTGERPGVGKSFVCANLAEVLSQLDKKVLVIDADMRRGMLQSIFATEKNVGLAEYFAEEVECATSITHATTFDNIDFIPKGDNPHNPSAILASSKFRELMAELTLRYNYIVIDSPPVLAVTDAIILANHADTVLMVTRHNDSLEGQLAYAIQQMKKADITVDGIVINDMKESMMAKNSYYYSYSYGT